MNSSSSKEWLLGRRNPNARKLADVYGDEYVNSEDHWYKLAEGRWRYAKDHCVEMGFANRQELAIYCRSIASTHCPVLGIRLSFYKGASGPNPASYSIDRIDARKGYVKGNIQILSVKANRIKNDATPEELRRFAVWVLKNG